MSDLINYPWRDVTVEWNAYLHRYRLENGRHLHGTLRGSVSKEQPKGLDRMHCALLVVVPLYQGSPLDLSGRLIVDFWDLMRIFARPYSTMFRGGVKEVCDDDRLREVIAHIIERHNDALAESMR